MNKNNIVIYLINAASAIKMLRQPKKINKIEKQYISIVFLLYASIWKYKSQTIENSFIAAFDFGMHCSRKTN